MRIAKPARKLLAVLALACTATIPSQVSAEVPRDAVRAEWNRHFDELNTIIANGGYLYRPEILDRLEEVDPNLAARGIGNDHIASALDKQAFYHATDQDPLDIVFRRTKALLTHLTNLPEWKLRDRRADFRAQLEEFGQRAVGGTPDARKALYLEVCQLRRQLAFSNPLLNFDEMLLGSRPDVRNCVWMSWAAGKGVWIVHDPFGPAPRVRNIFDGKVVTRGRYAGRSLANGFFSSLELSFDAKKILFSWCPEIPSYEVYGDSDNVFHIFEADVDGSNCVQLTDGPFPDMDPCYLPSGRIAFTSYRRSPDMIRMYIRCLARYPNVYTLHSMAADGSDIVTMSYHDLPEYNPSVDHDGKIVYTRWDYYDKASHWTGNLWLTNPDGRDPRSLHGNYFLPHQTFDRSLPSGKGTGMGNPQMEQGIRAVPGSPGYYAATVSSVHGGERGSLVLINIQKEDDYGMGQVSRLTPEIVFPESEWYSMKYGLGEKVYGYCWPLDRDFYLCSYGRNIYYLDRFGNRELIVAFEEVPGATEGLVDPIPLRRRPKPPVIPVATYEGRRNKLPHSPATIRIMTIHDSDLPWPPGVVEKREIKWLRVIQFFPKTEDGQAETHRKKQGGLGVYANTDYGGTNNPRMPLGVVPVEDDGSVNFYAPIHKDIYFQALDANGMAIQSMRSATYVQAGEQLTCHGCHENKWRAPRITGRPKAMRRAPSVLTTEVPDGAVPFNFYRLVKPVFEKTCIPCHMKHPEHYRQMTDASRLGPPESRVEQFVSSDPVQAPWAHARFSDEPYDPAKMTYDSLQKYVFCNVAQRSIGGELSMGSRTIPGHYGARVSRMGQALLNPTHQAAREAGTITEEDFRRIVLWLDCNSAQFGTVHSQDLVEAQKRGEVAFPVVDFQPWNPLGLEIYNGDATPPSTVKDLRATPESGASVRVEFAWTPSEDRESGVGCYAVYRDGEFLKWSLEPNSDDNHPILEQHVYEVAAVNRSGLEGAKSSPVTISLQNSPTSLPLLNGDFANAK